MKNDEITFFITCYICRVRYNMPIRDVVSIFDGIIHHKICWYLLKKWAHLGFYEYGVSLDLGWFKCPIFMSELYKELLVKFGFYSDDMTVSILTPNELRRLYGLETI